MCKNGVFYFGYLCQDKHRWWKFIIIKMQPHYDLLYDNTRLSVSTALCSMKLVYCLPIRYQNGTSV
jgi:hypothetical protein